MVTLRFTALAWLGLFMSFLLAAPAAAQQHPPSLVRLPAAAGVSDSLRPPRLPITPEQDRPAYGWMVAGGLLGGALGAGMGALIGAETSIGAAVFGGTVGMGAGMPIGVHLANGARGNLPLAELASVGLSVGLFFLGGTEDGAGPLLLAAPFAGLGASVLIETNTTP